MENVYFNAHLTESIFFKPEQLYDKNRKILKNLDNIEKGKIYFVVERGRVRVEPKKVKLSSKGRLRIDLKLCDGSSIRETLDTAPLFIDCGQMFKKVFGNSNNLQKHIRSVDGIDEYNRVLSESGELPVIGISLLPEQQTKKNIALRLYTPDGQVFDTPFMIHNIISAYNIDTRDFPKIVYIGKSSCLSDRIYKHEKIQQALSVLDDDSDIYLYAFQYDTDKIIHKILENGKAHIERNYTSDVSDKDCLSLIEMSLINYFKPKLNRDYVNAVIPENDIFKSAISSRYTNLVMEVIHDEGSYWKFGSDLVAASYRHTASYKV